MAEGDDRQAVARRRELAAQAIDPCVTGSAAVTAFWEGAEGGLDPQAAYEAIHDQVEAVRRGMLSGVEATLVGQAAALNAMFVDLARRGGASLTKSPHAAERYLRLALRAQHQCRETLDSLTAIARRPSKIYEEDDAARRLARQVVVTQTNISQTNIANGPMQVTNAAFPSPGRDPHAGHARDETGVDAEDETEDARMERDYTDWLDAGAARGGGAQDQGRAAVGAFDRAAYR